MQGEQGIGVIGGGAWGTALAELLAAAGREVMLWVRNPALARDINSHRMNRAYLPEVALSPGVKAVTEMAALGGAELVLLATPAQALGGIAEGLVPHLGAGATLVICSKGIECQSLRVMSEVVAARAPANPVAILSGPTFAAEVARGLPTAVTLACRDPELGAAIAGQIGQPHFRPYYSADVSGVEIGGAIKNVIAIACGIVQGRSLGENARAALMTRGLAEMRRYGQAKGAKAETLMGLSGLGDLALTCNSPKSRNMSLGIALGEGREIEAVLGARATVAEGVATAAALARLGDALGLELPIAAAVDRICNQGGDIDAEIRQLLARPFRDEDG